MFKLDYTNMRSSDIKRGVKIKMCIKLVSNTRKILYIKATSYKIELYEMPL